VAVHAIDPPPGFRRYRRYHTGSKRLPSGAVWRDAAAAVREVDVDAIEPRGFIHRDHHAGNVLWSRGRVSGVVDWVEACEGPLAIDAARARTNLVWHSGIDAAREYASVDGVVVDPVCDLLDALDCLTYGRPDDALLHELDGFIAEALAQLRA
jgi:aminoglycoside phosphotransferase (APT) family kinase protein